MIAFAPPVAANEPLVQPYHERASSWRTVVIVGPQLVAPPRPAMRPNAGAGPSGTTHRPPAETGSLQPPPPALPAPPRLLGPGHAMDGVASYYWQDQMTANGEKFNKRAMTAAHRTLPFGTKVRVTHARTGRAVVVRINDRGPFKKSRVIDLSEAAAEAIGMTGAGLAPVKIDVVSR
ncbi:MAG: septal ring lytic transglycosylase RlpA family lipoprotein [Hyphomicrobium sp.]|nr:septal ring lytic transglycosylase RlpA family lipoprotein [Rhodospirillum sp.]MBA4172460.1 septal ring lytic transglycosylase RlpA family lipoprotein [Hyphomicrobium sp.]PPC82347.1 MAG: septal ring lytic transglycosylase RlpA family lipoprotein [Hyphomicrobium sp.]